MLGKLQSLELPSIATKALLEGIDSPALRVLAGLDTSPTLAGEREEYFGRACTELGIAFKENKEAASYLLESLLTDIREGRMQPYEGCCKIVSEIYYGVPELFKGEKVCGESLDIAELVGIYWTYDDLKTKDLMSKGRFVSKEEGKKILDDGVLAFAGKRTEKPSAHPT
jgi:hypothetical protein